MTGELVDPREPLERQNEKLRAISAALMRRVESQTERSGAAYAQFERAVVLEDQVRRRTDELETALALLNESNARLAEAMRAAEEAHSAMASAIEAVREGFALFDATDALMLYNRRFCWHLPDVRQALAPGMRFSDYIAEVARSRVLSLPEGTGRADWARDRMRRHRDERSIFNLALRGDRWLQISEHRTENGGTAIVQTDVTDIIRAERLERDKLLDGQARMIRATLDHLRQGVAIFDAEARLVGWNDRIRQLAGLPPTAWRLGMSFARVAEHLAQDFTMADPQDERRLGLWVSGHAAQHQLSFEIARGAGLVLDVFMQRLPDAGFVLSFTDVTREREATRTLAQANETLERRVRERTLELQEALKTARRSNAARTRFVAAASHDLMQPLSAAKLYLATATAGGGCETAPARAIARAEQALSSVEEIIGALLDISRLETGEEELTRTPIPLSEVIGPVATAFVPLAAARGLRLRVVDSSLTVLSDAHYLRRILQNLLSNAIRYTGHGSVLVGVRRRGGQARLEVHDTGPGIAEEHRAAIFEEFRRLHRRASAAEGMGLGLAIVERACARLGHPLDLVSEPGRGSAFRVTLDAVIGPAARAPAHASPGEPGGDFGEAAPILMLVDDDAGLRSALVTLLESWGVAVIEASGAEEALALLDEVGIVPDGFLFDQQLGGAETGLSLARTVARRYGARPMRIMSADRSQALRDACARVRIPLLPKPLDMTHLRAFAAEAAEAAPRTETP